MEKWRHYLRKDVPLGTMRYVALTLFILVLDFPLYWILSSSLQTEQGILSVPPNLFPKKGNFTLEAFRIAFFERAGASGDVHPTLTWLLNSVYVSSASSALAILLGLWGGYVLSRFKFAGTYAVGFLVLLTQMLPGSLMIIPMYMIMTQVSLTNSLSGLALAYVSAHLPFSIWLLKGFYDGIPVDLEEQGLIDGCTRFGALIRITTPLILPGIVATFMFNFIESWGEYVVATTLIDSVQRWTYSVGAASLRGEHQVRWNEIMAVSFVGTLPVFALFLYMQRYLLAGLTAGGVKG